MIKIISLIPLLLFSSLIFAQPAVQIGVNHQFYSKYLEEERTIHIYLPDGYNDTNKKYPTLYILDGQWYFLNGVAIQNTLRGEYLLPEMIVVGINMERPRRDDVFGNQWNDFIFFIEQELVPYVDQKFRTKDERVLFGWETSAFLVCEIILRKEGLFEGAIASNGASINTDMLTALDSLNHRRYLYLANSNKDIYTITSSNRAAETLVKIDPKNLTWEYRKFNNEIHESMAYLTLYHGLKFFYHNFGSFAFSSIEDFNKQGGLACVKKYFQERGERFGLPTDIDDGTKNTLIWLAWRRDNFEAFSLFMNEFQDVLATKRYASAYWQNRLAQFYLKHKAHDKAVSFFEKGITNYPEKKYLAQMYFGLGEAYLGKSNLEKAKLNFKSALVKAEENKDPKVDLYRNKVNELK